ncbi:UNVERIFIED_CONTAM: hypothetical protein Sindi_1643300 [Sesamum indicum]
MADLNQNGRIVAEQLEREALYIHPSENSSLALSSSLLDGTNLLTWTRVVYVALGTKMKLGFIDSTFPRPAIGSTNFGQWRRVDLMVTSWLWNSISKEIVESFMYVTSSHELCLHNQAEEILERATGFGTYSKVYLWLLERSRVLMQDPLPTMERVFSMLFTVEKQRQIHTETTATPQHMACQLVSKDSRRDGGDRFKNKRRPYVDKRNLTCTHCHRTEHAMDMDMCFQIHSVPDWYKTLGDKKKKVVSGKTFAAIAIAEKPTSVDTSDTK